MIQLKNKIEEQQQFIKKQSKFIKEIMNHLKLKNKINRKNLWVDFCFVWILFASIINLIVFGLILNSDLFYTLLLILLMIYAAIMFIVIEKF